MIQVFNTTATDYVYEKKYDLLVDAKKYNTFTIGNLSVYKSICIEEVDGDVGIIRELKIWSQDQEDDDGLEYLKQNYKKMINDFIQEVGFDIGKAMHSTLFFMMEGVVQSLQMPVEKHIEMDVAELNKFAMRHYNTSEACLTGIKMYQEEGFSYDFAHHAFAAPEPAEGFSW